MSRFAATWFKNILCPRFVMGFLATLTILAGFAAGQNDYNKPSEVGEGSLLYRSPISGKYEPVPLVHTDVALDVRGLVAFRVEAPLARREPHP